MKIPSEWECFSTFQRQTQIKEESSVKRINTALIIALIISLALTGCGGGSKDTTKIGGNSPITSPVTEGKIELEGGGEINFGTGKGGENMELPADFPVDVVPLLEDAKINFVNTNDANNAIGITFLTDKHFDEAVSFYQEVMAAGEINMENKGDSSYLVMGAKGDYVVTISITKTPDNKSNVLLDVTPKSN